MSFAGQVLWKRQVIVCAWLTMGTYMALAATAAPFRRLRRRVLLLLCVIVVSFYMGCLDHPDLPSWEERCMS